MLKFESASLIPANHAFVPRGVVSNPSHLNFIFGTLGPSPPCTCPPLGGPTPRRGGKNHREGWGGVLYQSINFSNLCTLGVRIFPLILFIKSLIALSSYTVQTTSFDPITALMFPYPNHSVKFFANCRSFSWKAILIYGYCNWFFSSLPPFGGGVFGVIILPSPSINPANQ